MEYEYIRRAEDVNGKCGMNGERQRQRLNIEDRMSKDQGVKTAKDK
jgi:hypothetical protein